MDDAKLSAYVWLVNNAFWAELRSKTAPERVLVLDGEEVSDAPETTLARVLAFFGVTFTPEDVARIATSEAASHHSKRPNNQYGASQRRADLLDWQRRFGSEADQAVEWASGIAQNLKLGCIDGPVAGVAPRVSDSLMLLPETA